MRPSSFEPPIVQADPPTRRLRQVLRFLAQQEVGLAILLVGLSMLWTSTLPWVVLGLGLLSLLRWWSCGQWSVRTPADVPVLILGVMALLSLWVTPLPEVTFPQVCRLLTGLGLFYVIINWLARTELAGWMVAGVAGLAPALALLAVFSVEWPEGKLPLIPASLYDHFSSLFQDVIHPNVLAGNLAVVLPLGLALFLFDWGNHTITPLGKALLRSLLAGALAFSVLILFLTQSRGSWMAFGMAAALLIILRFRWGWVLVVLTGAGSLGIMVHYLDYAWLLRWLRSSYQIGDLYNRMELWARGVYMLEDFFFTGIGMGTFTHTTDHFYPLQSAAPPHVHNLFLQVGVDLGVPGLLAWLAIFMLVAWAAWHLYRMPGASNLLMRVLGAGMLGSLVAVAFHGWFDAVTWGMIRPAPLIWALWGLCLGAFLRTSHLPGEH